MYSESIDTHLSSHSNDRFKYFSTIVFSIKIFNDPRVECEAKTFLIKPSATDNSRPKETAAAQKRLKNETFMNIRGKKPDYFLLLQLYIIYY